MPKEKPVDQSGSPVRLTGWVFEVRQIGANEERSVLTLRKRRVNAKVACLSYAEGSCCVMQWMLPPP